MNVVIGTRGSKLALIQAQAVQQILQKALVKDTICIRIIKTYGDKNQRCALHEMGTQGVFVKEIERKLQAHEIDLAVHSLKDLPAQLAEEFTLLKPVIAEDARDALVYRREDGKQINIIGTGSQRRKLLAQQLYPDALVKGIRGNVDQRLKKLADGEFDALILAAAGLHRLGLHDKIATYLDPTEFIPAAGQGILGLEIRKQDAWLREALAPFVNKEAALRMKAERAFLQAVNGDCHMPIGAYFMKREDQYVLYGLLGDSTHAIKDQISGKEDEAEMMGYTLGKRMKKRLEEAVWE